MFRLTKKLICTVVLLASILFIGGCSPKPEKETSSKDVATGITGEWQLTDIRNAVQKTYFIHDMYGRTFATFLPQFDALDMRLTIDKDQAQVTYDYDLNTYLTNYYAIAKKTKTEEEFKKRTTPRY